MRDYFIRLYDYDSWANRELLTSLRSCPALPPRALEWLGHLLVAQQFVLEVLSGRDGNWLQERTALDFAECEELIAELSAAWRRYFDGQSADDITSEITFRNSRGEIVTRRVTDLLTHGINHSTYHRGQIALEVRAAGGEPARIDFPVWVGRTGQK